MKRLWLAGLLVGALGSVSRAEDNRYMVFQGYIPTSAVENGKTAPQAPVVLKVDTSTGDTWRLVIANGYWWLPVKNGRIAEKASAAAPAEPAPADAAAPEAAPKK